MNYFEEIMSIDISIDNLLARIILDNNRLSMENVSFDTYRVSYGPQYSASRTMGRMFYYQNYLEMLYGPFFEAVTKMNQSEMGSETHKKMDQFKESHKWLKESRNILILDYLSSIHKPVPDKPYFPMFKDGMFSVVSHEKLVPPTRRISLLEEHTYWDTDLLPRRTERPRRKVRGNLR